MPTVLQHRFAALPAAPLDDALQLSTGTMRDYHALSRFHYRSRRPATCLRVLTLRWDRPSVVGRYLQRDDESMIVGVLVKSLPALACKLRDVALGGRYAQLGSLRQRAAALNAEVRCISRVVVHPQWRGLGLSVRLVRTALDTATTPLTEALAAMGNVHPFFEKAGMTAYRRPPHAHDARLADALRGAGLDLLQLSDTETAMARIRASPRRAHLEAEMRRWHRAALRGEAATDLRDCLLHARRRLLAEPVYFLKRRE